MKDPIIYYDIAQMYGTDVSSTKLAFELVGRSDKEPLIVNGINITEVIQGLTGRLF